MAQYYQGVNRLLSNLIIQERQANLAKETPQYQQALFNLQQTKLQADFQKEIKKQLINAKNATEMLRILGGAGDVPAVKELSGIEQAPIEAARERVEGLPRVFGQFDIKDPQTAIRVAQGDPNALLDVPVRPRSPLVRIGIDTFERARQTALGSAAGKAQTTINSVNAIVGDVKDMFSLFHNIPETLRGGVVSGGIGQVGKLTQSDIRSYFGVRQLTLANIAKKLGGEVGVLTDRDIERITMALPNLIDPEETVFAKERFVYNYMDRRVKAYQKTARVPVIGIDMPAKYRDSKFNLDKKQSWESERQVSTQENLSAEDIYINSILNPGQ